MVIFLTFVLSETQPSAESFARKRGNAWQILFDFGASPTQNSDGAHHVNCAHKISAAFGTEIAQLRRSKAGKFK